MSATTTATATARPRVTLSLVTYNGERWLPGCLASVAAQRLDDYELLVLDNASTDGTRQLLHDAARTDPRIAVDFSADNLGYAAGHNRLIERARGEFVALLNQDLELDDGFLGAAVDGFAAGPRVGAVQGRVLRLAAPGERLAVIDTTGLEMNRDRRVVARGHGEPDGPPYADAGPVFGADGPVPVFRLAALRDAREPSSHGGWEVLDEDFFMYKEDVDLAWRLRRLGWTATYAPTAVAWHARTSPGPRRASVRAIARTNRSVPSWIATISWRNQRLMQLKNDRLDDYVRDLPWIALREILAWGFVLVADPRRLWAVPQLVRLLPLVLRKRRYLVHRFAGQPRTHEALTSEPWGDRVDD